MLKKSNTENITQTKKFLSGKNMLLLVETFKLFYLWPNLNVRFRNLACVIPHCAFDKLQFHESCDPNVLTEINSKSVGSKYVWEQYCPDTGWCCHKHICHSTTSPSGLWWDEFNGVNWECVPPKAWPSALSRMACRAHSHMIRGVQVAVDRKGIHAALKRLEDLQVLLLCSHLTPFSVWKC